PTNAKPTSAPNSSNPTTSAQPWPLSASTSPWSNQRAPNSPTSPKPTSRESIGEDGKCGDADERRKKFAAVERAFGDIDGGEGAVGECSAS
ncbi:hypothetical protein HK102_009944, partial [Quaeritorhiza haematococci]